MMSARLYAGAALLIAAMVTFAVWGTAIITLPVTLLAVLLILCSFGQEEGENNGAHR